MIRSSQYGLSDKQTLGLTENDYFEQLKQKFCKTEASIIYKGAKII